MHLSSPPYALEFTGLRGKEVSSTAKLLVVVSRVQVCEEVEGMYPRIGTGVSVKEDADTLL